MDLLDPENPDGPSSQVLTRGGGGGAMRVHVTAGEQKNLSGGLLPDHQGQNQNTGGSVRARGGGAFTCTGEVIRGAWTSPTQEEGSDPRQTGARLVLRRLVLLVLTGSDWFCWF